VKSAGLVVAGAGDDGALLMPAVGALVAAVVGGGGVDERIAVTGQMVT
jgi:hypothetical protein